MTHTLTPPARPDARIDDVARVLTPDGERIADSALDPFLEDVSLDDLRALYLDMAVLRRIDAEGIALQRQGQLGLWAPCRGQEASQIGTIRGFRDDDRVFPSYRETGVLYARGVEPGGFVRAWRGEAHSSYDPTRLNVAPMQIIIGAQTLHAVGYAMGVQRDDATRPEGCSEVVGVYFGDGATSQGDVSEALVFASSFRAPVVFICINNQYAISEPVSVQSAFPIAGRAPGFGIPSLRVDGNDVLACLAAARWAAHHAREGEGPAFVEAVTYRMGPHTTADDPTRYRTDDEVQAWAGRDPLARVEAYLREEGRFDDDFAREVAEASDRTAAAMRDACIGMTTAPPGDVFAHVYAEPHAGLDAQRDAYLAYLDGFADETGETGDTDASGDGSTR